MSARATTMGRAWELAVDVSRLAPTDDVGGRRIYNLDVEMFPYELEGLVTEARKRGTATSVEIGRRLYSYAKVMRERAQVDQTCREALDYVTEADKEIASLKAALAKAQRTAVLVQLAKPKKRKATKRTAKKAAKPKPRKSVKK